MKTIDRIVGVITIIVLCTILFYIFKCQPSMEGIQGISVQGEAIAQVQPDTLTLNFNVQQKADTSLEAQTKIDEISKNFIAKVKELGVNSNNIQTSNYSVSENAYWDTEGKKISDGYQASQSITVTLNGDGFVELGQKVLSTAPTVGNITIYNSSFSLKDRSAGQAGVRDLAVEAAYKKAEQLAKAAGVKLGKPIVISETSSGGDIYYPTMYNAKANLAVGSATNSVGLEAGTSEVRVSVSITYEIK